MNSPQKRRATIKDVAQLIDTSSAIVSMALRGDPRISEETRLRVEAAAREVGYVYNRSAANLRKQCSDIVGLVVGDSGFCRPRLLRWCERRNVSYIVGIAKNSRLEKLALKRRYEAAIRFRNTRVKQRLFTSVEYKAKSWKKRKRRIIAKYEFS